MFFRLYQFKSDMSRTFIFYILHIDVLYQIKYYTEVLDMWEDEFAMRLARLRFEKGVSAREMSLSIGQNSGYINNIENGKSLPSMPAFLFICDYLGITPAEFFDLDNQSPERLRRISSWLKMLSDEQLSSIEIIVRDLAKK